MSTTPVVSSLIASAPEVSSSEVLRLPQVEILRKRPFHFEDSQVVLQVERNTYKVHRYFLVRESPFFRDLFSLPQSGDTTVVEGSDDEHPIFLPDTAVSEFESLLRFLYFGMHDDNNLTLKDWITMLSISTRFIFDKVRERAIKEITTHLDQFNPFELIGLATKYDVQQWLKPAYEKAVTRTDLISHAEALKVPSPIVVMLMRSREQYWKNRGHPSTATPIIDSEVILMDLASRESQMVGI
ncbi:hypothetical protein BJV78DRAFT_1207359 [Lactifluus subvellereus]|nr:hypothetical protein BJV78DRAFT_1207359 [Lactifluus subvellereus]